MDTMRQMTECKIFRSPISSSIPPLSLFHRETWYLPNDKFHGLPWKNHNRIQAFFLLVKLLKVETTIIMIAKIYAGTDGLTPKG